MWDTSSALANLFNALCVCRIRPAVR
uniref:Uncharacterized protein n=1 Tax=Anguilla anguilla TaxID=7936 RepID=A0A0E9UEZ6_ANGAN